MRRTTYLALALGLTLACPLAKCAFLQSRHHDGAHHMRRPLASQLQQHPKKSIQAWQLFDSQSSSFTISKYNNSTVAEVEESFAYRSNLLDSGEKWQAFLDERIRKGRPDKDPEDTDLFWEQIKLEAETALSSEPQAGPQLYQGILSHDSLMSAVSTVVSHEIETELIPATALKNLFMDLLDARDEFCIRRDLHATATRSPTVRTAMDAILFHNGFHALVCYRIGHRLWQVDRTGLAYYMQSTVSRKYSADIHPACVMGHGIYLRVGGGVVIGETAVVGDDVSILEGVTLGGTGKEAGNRHPKVGNGVIIQDGGTVLGNISVGEGSIVLAKSIVTKPVPALAVVEGVPARITAFRDLQEETLRDDDLQRHLCIKYLERWRRMADEIQTGLNS